MTERSNQDWRGEGGRSPSGRAVVNGAASVSAVPASVPSALLETVISVIRAEAERLHGEDYIMDDRDVIELLREKFPASRPAGEKLLHVMPGDPDDLNQSALQWYLNFEFGYPHSVRESNIAVQAFKDGYRAAQGMSAGTVETQSGSGPQDRQPDPEGDAPNPLNSEV